MGRQEWLDCSEANRRIWLLSQKRPVGSIEEIMGLRRARAMRRVGADSHQNQNQAGHQTFEFFLRQLTLHDELLHPRPVLQLQAVLSHSLLKLQELSLCHTDLHHKKLLEQDRSNKESTRKERVLHLTSFPLITANYIHQSMAYSGYICTWLTFTLNGNNWSRISCLSPECNKVVQYKKYATRDVIGALPNFRYCLNPNCNSGQEHIPGADAIFIRNACGHCTCVICDRPCYAGQSCSETDPRRRQAEDILSLGRIQQTALRCPNTKSNVPIEKNKGYTHMMWLSYDLEGRGRLGDGT
ncbi:hypothetical protein N431DRAFT_447866 [Stipitochalara longipes BDJ]|nr:hypothetical protein N431DRAFT_447866 [Stipitochalara longipes BDJ]